MKKPTAEEIKAEIKNLESLKPRVRRWSMFQDDNWAAIDAQLEVMRDDLDENAIYDRSRDEAEDDETSEDKWPLNVREAALSARRWMDGEESESPVF